MKVREYVCEKIVEFKEEDILYIIVNRMEGITHFKNGETKSILMMREMFNLLARMTRVFNFDKYRAIYINVKEIESYKIDGIIVDIKFKNGDVLKGVSKNFLRCLPFQNLNKKEKFKNKF